MYKPDLLRCSARADAGVSVYLVEESEPTEIIIIIIRRVASGINVETEKVSCCGTSGR